MHRPAPPDDRSSAERPAAAPGNGGPASDLVQLVYVSRPTMSLTQHAAQRIVALSRHHNWRAGVTGCLLFTGTGIAQALEGRAEPVRRLYDCIVRDPRHTHIRIAFESGVAARSFPDWAMGFVPDAALATEIVALLDAGAPSPAGVARLMGRMTADAFLGAS